MKYMNEHVGRYDVQIIGVDGKIRVEKTIYNTITDGFLRLLSESLYGNVDLPELLAIAVGDGGGTAEDGTSTILVNEITRKGIGPNRLLDDTLPLITTFVNFAYEDFPDAGLGLPIGMNEIGVFAKDTTAAETITTTANTGRMVSRISSGFNETLIAGEVLRINRSDEFRRFGV